MSRCRKVFIPSHFIFVSFLVGIHCFCDLERVLLIYVYVNFVLLFLRYLTASIMNSIQLIETFSFWQVSFFFCNFVSLRDLLRPLTTPPPTPRGDIYIRFVLTPPQFPVRLVALQRNYNAQRLIKAQTGE